MSNIKLGLKDIPKFISCLETFREDVRKLPKVISKDMAETAERLLKELYTHMYKDPNLEIPNVRIKETEKGYKVLIEGKDVIYIEFGTGDEGEEHPHPKKSEYPLKGYNTGPFIRNVNTIDQDSYTGEDLKEIGITSGKFWYYTRNGMGHYTQGVPAGKEIYRTIEYLKKQKDKIIRKRVDEINDKFIKSIKK